jgi:pyruvate/2-oxoglutarate dehydrogenase complex dihydrolipoamide acyltransferase (E2) component
MKGNFTLHQIPSSRVATMDVYSAGSSRHHVAALLELDVTGSRQRLRELKRGGNRASFTAWIIQTIGLAIREHPESAAFLKNKKQLITFHDINISTMVEKEVEGKRVPMPLVIENVPQKSIADITEELERARETPLSRSDLVINRKKRTYESLYTSLPGFLRRTIWSWIQRHPRTAFQQMGNVMVTSLSMMGKINGWFLFKTVHPVAFGIGAVTRKPWVVGDEIMPREILHLTVLMDHDVIDGAPMVRFIKDLARRIEIGDNL